MVLNLNKDFQSYYNQPKFQQNSSIEKNLKRTLSNQQNSEDEDTSNKNATDGTSNTMMDIYKQRQQKKLVKQA